MARANQIQGIPQTRGARARAAAAYRVASHSYRSHPPMSAIRAASLQPSDVDAAAILHRHCVTVRGRGAAPLVFAHGFGCDQNMWRFVAPAFEREHTVVTFDYAGCGRGDRAAWNPVRHGTLDGYAADLVDVCDALRLRDAVLVGHSVSSVIGILAAIRRPELFARLVLVGPSPRYLDDAPDYVGGFARADVEGLLELMDRNYIGWANYLAPVVVQNPERPEHARELEASFCSTDPVVARSFAAVTFLGDNRADLPRLQQPALVLQCTDDAIAPRTVGEYTARHVRDGRLRVLEARGHCPHVTDPDETIDAIRDSLAAA